MSQWNTSGPPTTRPSARRRGAAVALVLALLALAGPMACSKPGATPIGAPVTLGVHRAPMPPSDVDHAAADLAAASLAGDLGAAAQALARIQQDDALRERIGEPASGLAPYAIDVWNASRYPDRTYRDATERLLERDDLTDGLRERLTRTLDDDPLALAQARSYDAFMIEAARLFNRLAEPAGKAITTTAMLPYHIAMAIAGYLIEVVEQDPLPLQRRQALGLWKQFLRRYPDAVESPDVERKVARDQERLDATLLREANRKANEALGLGLPRHALFHAERGLRFVPGDEDCLEIRAEAEKQISSRDERLLALLIAPRASSAAFPPGTRELALAMLAPDGDPAAALDTLPDGHPLIPEARFAAATLEGEAGRDDVMNATLRELAERRDSPMARHARTVLADPVRNPYDAFDRLRDRDELRRLLVILTGPALVPPRDWRLSSIVRWLMGLPSRLQAIVGLPMRLATIPFSPPSAASAETALQARRYLALHPGGRHAPEVSAWLEGYERDRRNWLGALKVVSDRSHPDPQRVEELRELAASQALFVAKKEKRRDLRNAMLHNVTRQFPDTESGREAGKLARTEVEDLRAHSVQISRGFLEENRSLAGPEGLALDPTLLDGDNSNGELHPEGVRLVGGREIELHYVAADGDEDEPPEKVIIRVSEERLARLVARLEERSFHNALIDTDAAIEADAQRDLLFERSRIGLADQVDTRPTAEANYSYKGLRERYGMVRSRESILPFDLVLQGSLETLSLGAFPRLRTPKKTPDAILYE